SDRDHAPRLQRHGPDLQHGDPAVPRCADRERLPLRAAQVLRCARGGRGDTGGELLRGQAGRANRGPEVLSGAMRRAFLIVVVLLAIPLALPAGAQARSLTVANADVSLRLAPDASLIVRERLTVDYDGSYNATYRDIPLAAGESISTSQVTVAE